MSSIILDEGCPTCTKKKELEGPVLFSWLIWASLGLSCSFDMGKGNSQVPKVSKFWKCLLVWSCFPLCFCSCTGLMFVRHGCLLPIMLTFPIILDFQLLSAQCCWWLTGWRSPFGKAVSRRVSWCHSLVLPLTALSGIMLFAWVCSWRFSTAWEER